MIASEYESIWKEALKENSPMKTQIPIHYRKAEQRVEFHCPFCNQTQAWTAGVFVGEDGEVSPAPKVTFTEHLLGESKEADRCFVRPSVDEVEEYEPVARIEA